MSSGAIARLEQRIKRLKNDVDSANNWRKLRFEIEKHHGRWVAPNGTVFELRDGVIYQYLGDSKEGVSEMIVTALDAEVPYVAVLALDLQGTPPEKRKALLKQLDDEARRSVAPATEIITIVENDWLSKIAKKRWGDPHLWKRHLKPTSFTRGAPKRQGRPYDPNLIYPGDTFEVVP